MNKETLMQKIAEIKKEYEEAFPKDFYNWSEYGFWVDKLSNIASLISQSESKEQSEFGPVDLTNVEPDKFNLKIKEDSK